MVNPAGHTPAPINQYPIILIIFYQGFEKGGVCLQNRLCFQTAQHCTPLGKSQQYAKMTTMWLVLLTVAGFAHQGKVHMINIAIYHLINGKMLKAIYCLKMY